MAVEIAKRVPSRLTCYRKFFKLIVFLEDTELRLARLLWLFFFRDLGLSRF